MKFRAVGFWFRMQECNHKISLGLPVAATPHGLGKSRARNLGRRVTKSTDVHVGSSNTMGQHIFYCVAKYPSGSFYQITICPFIG